MALPLAAKIDTAHVFEQWQAGATYRELAQKYGVSHSTIQRFIMQQRLESEDHKYNQAHLPDSLEATAMDILNSIDSEVIANATLQQRSIASAILIDKMRLLRGESTANIAVNESIMIINKRARDARLTTIQADNSQAPTEE